jgi:RsiW-degrading membrane proteinase PrsW (M82 family)
MLAGIVLVALGLKTTLGNVDDPLETVPAFALLGGIAAYLLGLVGFRFRHVHTINRHRLVLALALVALLPAADGVPALAVLAVVAVVLWAMIVYETISYGPGRAQVRRELAHERSSG